MIVKILKENSDGTCVVLTQPCIECGQSTRLSLDTAKVKAWLGGRNIQTAFTDMKPDERELLISGVHPECWDNIFGSEEE